MFLAQAPGSLWGSCGKKNGSEAGPQTPVAQYVLHRAPVRTAEPRLRLLYPENYLMRVLVGRSWHRLWWCWGLKKESLGKSGWGWFRWEPGDFSLAGWLATAKIEPAVLLVVSLALIWVRIPSVIWGVPVIKWRWGKTQTLKPSVVPATEAVPFRLHVHFWTEGIWVQSRPHSGMWPEGESLSGSTLACSVKEESSGEPQTGSQGLGPDSIVIPLMGC